MSNYSSDLLGFSTFIIPSLNSDRLSLYCMPLIVGGIRLVMGNPGRSRRGGMFKDLSV